MQRTVPYADPGKAIDRAITRLEGRNGKGIHISGHVDPMAFLAVNAHRLTEDHVGRLLAIQNLYLTEERIRGKVIRVTRQDAA